MSNQQKVEGAGGVNAVVVVGECAGPPEVRALGSGRRLASLAVRVRAEGATATSVPVTVWEPAGWVEDLEGGEPLVVVGTVRRRFFRRAAGGTGTQTDVEATYVGRAGNRRQLTTARRRVEALLDALEG
jgi:hypothetical protein